MTAFDYKKEYKELKIEDSGIDCKSSTDCRVL